MGRRKIEIEFIREDRSRATTFIKRKSGLFKKAHELAILTGAQVAVVVFSQQDRLFTYSNAPCSDICTKFLESSEPYETKGPQDYSANNDNDDDTDDEMIANAPSRKSSNAGHGKSESTLIHVQNGSPSLLSRRASAQTPERTSSPKDSAQSKPITARDNPRASSPRLQKRGTSPLSERNSEGPKYQRHDQGPREVSDVRSSPHQSLATRSGSAVSTPPLTQTSEFSSTHMAAPMVPPPQMYSQQVSSMGPQYVNHSQQIRQAQMQQHQQEQHAHQFAREQQQQHHHHHQLAQAGAQQQHRHAGDNMQYQRVEYSGPTYEPPQSNARQLPMAPPLAIPVTAPSNSTITAGHAPPSTSQTDSQRPAQPLLPTNSGPSRVLLREQGEAAGLTPIESPSNFASSLYSSSGIAGIGTNISMPRISTDVGSLFYNWNTNEPGLSPATSMMLGQFREGEGAAPMPGPTPVARSQMSGPPISAGVLENFSPTTAQWLSGHGIPPPQQASNGKPY
ncbi:SRF-type transcription factor RlmA [Taphrina deformans PYCC 5710]|uniref:SRF-type transcription factor RlmA n=1 Tax=Taphrina deformans (strain PYCC 5710 / ATCC 11124 / CBS 356.35 / IMI 108563 / JCM 9778 / NBRC 8474) TaxID=1097556 RepID=R4X9N4_TAPDE|nr:SRF-type transcription factor RlmA [Taphrina deformans PYCC 5710]|eukprot:CCG82476.1 SRF-type transcription factor RlmA [Taphrina deformans PYCC 5710]